MLGHDGAEGARKREKKALVWDSSDPWEEAEEEVVAALWALGCLGLPAPAPGLRVMQQQQKEKKPTT